MKQVPKFRQVSSEVRQLNTRLIVKCIKETNGARESGAVCRKTTVLADVDCN